MSSMLLMVLFFLSSLWKSSRRVAIASPSSPKLEKRWEAKKESAVGERTISSSS